MKKIRKYISMMIVAVLISGMIVGGMTLSGVNLLTGYASDDLVIVLDPGHDNVHHGASYFGILEEDVNMAIAISCKQELEKYRGVKVYLTHDTMDSAWPDVSSRQDNYNRTSYAADVDADLFVSIHNNAGSSTASGTEIYYPNYNYVPEFNTLGYELSVSISNQLENLGINQLGIYVRDSDEDELLDENFYPDGSRADYYNVIRNSKYHGFPGIIIEHVYMSNYNDYANYLCNDDMLEAMGIADATGIANYYGLSKGYKPDRDYSKVFDAEYYADRYPDVKDAIGTNPDNLLEHFVKRGMSEGRSGKASFDPEYYKNRYEDLRQMFGDDWKLYYLHYLNYGELEDRVGNGYDGAKSGVPLTYYDGIDYSAVYNYDYYIEHNADVADECDGNDLYALKHFVEHGMQEGRSGNDTFDVFYYQGRNEDLRAVYGDELKDYYIHYIMFGRNEGRVGNGYAGAQAATHLTYYNGVDYSNVYDYDYYVEHNADVAEMFGMNDYLTLKHFVNNGMAEGRVACDNFDVISYQNANVDLRQEFGYDMEAYFAHYMNYGQAEGRACNNVEERVGYVTTYNGTDYSDVYNENYYLAANEDVANVVGGDDIAALQHYVQYGIAEGRRASENFWVYAYAANYQDLREEFGTDLRAFTMHYINYGVKEGRNGGNI